MWKITAILCLTIFILVRGDAPEGALDSMQVMEILDNAKGEINEVVQDVYRRGLGYGEKAKKDLVNHTKTIRLELNKEINKIYKDIAKLFENLSDPIRRDCNEFTKGLYERVMILEDNMDDCILHTVATATSKLAETFASASHGINMLEIARDGVKVCDFLDDCQTYQREIFQYRDETVSEMAARHKEYVETIGNSTILDECINNSGFGYKALRDFLSNIVSDTLSCIKEWQHLAQD